MSFVNMSTSQKFFNYFMSAQRLQTSTTQINRFFLRLLEIYFMLAVPSFIHVCNVNKTKFFPDTKELNQTPENNIPNPITK